MYLDLAPNIRLRSCDTAQVVLEWFRKIEPTDKSADSYEAWVFAGYYPNVHFINTDIKAYSDVAKKYGRKFIRPIAIQHMIEQYDLFWRYLQGVDTRQVAQFIADAKALEHKKASEAAKAVAEKTKKAKG